MAYKITGRVLLIGAPVSLTSKSWTQFIKRDIVITVRKFDQYTGQPMDDADNTPKFSFMNDRCQSLCNVKVGDIVTIHFDLSGRRFETDGKTEYFNYLRPFRIEVQPQNQPQAYQSPQIDSNAPNHSTQPFPQQTWQNAPQQPLNAPQGNYSEPF